MDNEIQFIREIFSKEADKRATNASHKLSDILMSGFAMFSLKCKSVLGFEQLTEVEKINLFSVYGIEKVCSDTTLREVFDNINPKFLRDLFPEKFQTLRKTGILNDFCYKIGSTEYLIVSSDGVQHFSSKKCSCKHGLTKVHQDKA